MKENGDDEKKHKSPTLLEILFVILIVVGEIVAIISFVL